MLKNGQTYYKNLAMRTKQYFKSMFGHSSTLWMRELIYFVPNFHFISMFSSIPYLQPSRTSTMELFVEMLTTFRKKCSNIDVTPLQSLPNTFTQYWC